MWRGLVFAAALILAPAAFAQSMTLGNLNGLFATIESQNQTAGAIEREAGAFSPGAGAARMAARAELDRLIIAIENFQVARAGLAADLASLLRTSTALSRAGATAPLAQLDKARRQALMARINTLNSLNRELVGAIRSAATVLPGSSALIGPDGALRRQGTLRGAMGATLKKSEGANDLSPADLASLTRLLDAYQQLDEPYLRALTALYAARQRVLAVS
jgi:hypothetical protein